MQPTANGPFVSLQAPALWAALIFVCVLAIVVASEAYVIWQAYVSSMVLLKKEVAPWKSRLVHWCVPLNDAPLPRSLARSNPPTCAFLPPADLSYNTRTATSSSSSWRGFSTTSPTRSSAGAPPCSRA